MTACFVIKYSIKIPSLCFFRLYFHLPAIKTSLTRADALLGLIRLGRMVMAVPLLYHKTKTCNTHQKTKQN